MRLTSEPRRTMNIELKRAFTPEEVGVEEPCGICEVPFVAGVVTAHVLHHDLGTVCPACVEYLGRRNPERFPTIEELEEAKRRYTAPAYASVEEVMELERADDPSVHEAYWGSWLTRAPA